MIRGKKKQQLCLPTSPGLTENGSVVLDKLVAVILIIKQ